MSGPGPRPTCGSWLLPPGCFSELVAALKGLGRHRQSGPARTVPIGADPRSNKSPVVVVLRHHYASPLSLRLHRLDIRAGRNSVMVSSRGVTNSPHSEDRRRPSFNGPPVNVDQEAPIAAYRTGSRQPCKRHNRFPSTAFVLANEKLGIDMGGCPDRLQLHTSKYAFAGEIYIDDERYRLFPAPCRNPCLVFGTVAAAMVEQPSRAIRNPNRSIPYRFRVKSAMFTSPNERHY